MEDQDEIENPQADTEELTEEEAEFLGGNEPDTTQTDVAEPNSSDEADVGGIIISSGRAMSLAEATVYTASSRHKIILLAGAHKSGKTSLISDIFISFQRGEFPRISFAGSATLVGLEEKCWSARAASMRLAPKTKRTGTGEPAYIQLVVEYERGHKHKHNLFICDLSGEKYEKASRSAAECEQIKDIAWVDHFVLVLDGEKLADLKDREVVFSEAKNLLLRLIDIKMVSAATLIQIVFSKADRFDIEDPQNSLFLEQVKREFKNRLKARNMHPEFFFTSAHNIYGDIEKPFDLEKLLVYWLANSPKSVSDIKKIGAVGQREIDSFYHREFARTAIS